jgi:CBS domain-containing protein
MWPGRYRKNHDTPREEKIAMMVNEVMRTQPALVDPGSTIAEAARTVRDRDLGCLLVGRDGHLLGLVTDRDLVVRGLANGADPTRERVCDVMSSEVLSCFDDQPVESVRAIMAEQGVRRLPVVDRWGRLTGVVSLSDVQGGGVRNIKPHAVTFYKHLVDGSGTVHEVPLKTVYVAKVDDEDDATAVATAIFERYWGPARWKGTADGCRIDRGS